MENLIFNIRQKDFFVISQNLMGIRINAQILNMYTGVLGGAGLVVDVVAADQSLDSGEQFRVGKRFAQIVVSPHGKSSV